MEMKLKWHLDRGKTKKGSWFNQGDDVKEVRHFGALIVASREDYR